MRDDLTPNDFYVGQEVIVVGDTYPGLIGQKGVVACIRKRVTGSIVGVDFYPLFRYGNCNFHSLDNQLRSNTGWFFPWNEVEPFDVEELSPFDGEALASFMEC